MPDFRADTTYHAAMEEEEVTPWWRRALVGLGFALGLLALSGILMGGIIFVARFMDGSRSTVATPVPIATTPPPESARTRVPPPYAPEPWPSYPGRGSGLGGGGSRGASPGGQAKAPPARPPVPTGLSTEEYQAAVAAGKSIYLPNPKGECDLGSDQSLRALESCLAAQAAR